MCQTHFAHKCPEDIGNPGKVNLYLTLSREQVSEVLSTHGNRDLLLLNLGEDEAPVSVDLFEMVPDPAGPSSVSCIRPHKGFELLRDFQVGNAPLLNVPSLHRQSLRTNLNR